MTPAVPTLTAKGRLYAGLAGAVLIVLSITYLAGRHQGRQDQQAAVAQAAEAKLRDTVRILTARAATAETKATALEQRAARSAQATAAVATTTDVAIQHETATATVVVAVAHDSSATVPQLRAAVDSLAQVDSTLRAAVLAERGAAQRTLALTDSALVAKDSAIAASSAALLKALDDGNALDQEIAALHARQPGFVHRAVHGVESAVIGVGCYGVLSIVATPVAAIAGGAVCAAVAGAVLP